MLDLEAIRAERAKRSLTRFIREGWKVLEPETPYKHNWHIDAIAEHLEAVSSGQIRKLIINVPPGHMKSLSVCVFWPAWHWLQSPHWRFLYASYSADLSVRDSNKTKLLITSDWYQRHFGEKYQLTKENERRLENSKLGYRIATSTGGVGTGERVHVAVNDDLLRANDARSDLKREQAIEHMKAMSTRGVDPATFAQVLIMQRLHEEDPTGWAIEQGGWEQLILPAEFEPDRRAITSIGWQDPRTKEGELLWPEQFGPEEIGGIKKALGSYGTAAQLQQKPAPGDGGHFQPGMIRIVDALPFGMRKARGWDLAATLEADSASADWTVGVLIGRDDLMRIFICDVVRFRGSPLQVQQSLLNTAALDGHDVPISGPQDPGQAGKSQAFSFIQLLAGYDVEFSVETGDKVTRSSPFSAQVEAGNVHMLRAPWNKDLIDEMASFPNGRHDDQIDACSRAFHRLLTAKRWVF